MIWYALTTQDEVPPEAFWALVVAGILTIAYNGYNWLGNTMRGLPPLPL